MIRVKYCDSSGSRGIKNIHRIVKAAVQYVKDMGGFPFIVLRWEATEGLPQRAEGCAGGLRRNGGIHRCTYQVFNAGG